MTNTSPDASITEQDALIDGEVLTQGPQYNEPAKKTRIKWYRPRIEREDLAKLNKRSDFLGFVQTLGYLGILATAAGATASAATLAERKCSGRSRRPSSPRPRSASQPSLAA